MSRSSGHEVLRVQELALIWHCLGPWFPLSCTSAHTLCNQLTKTTSSSARSISRHMAPVDAQNSAILGAILPKWKKTCPKWGRTAMQNFTPIGKAPAEKSVTVHTKWIHKTFMRKKGHLHYFMIITMFNILMALTRRIGNVSEWICSSHLPLQFY